jgi:PAS domain S-box-containing protein
MVQQKTSAGTVRDDTRRPMTSGLHPFTGVSTAHPGFPAPTGPQHGLSPFAFVNDAIVQAAREAIITISEDQRIVMINPAAQRMFGLTAREALGTDLGRLIPQRYRHNHAMHVRAFDQSGTAVPMAPNFRSRRRFQGWTSSMAWDRGASSRHSSGTSAKFATCVARSRH